jgi:hypothetical protein
MLALLVVAAVERSLDAADWLQFRGADSSGVWDGEPPPRSWGEGQNLAWKAALPGRGLSSPIVAGERVFVTASSGAAQDRLHVLCFDLRSGAKLWERQFWATGPTQCHPKTCMAAPTPASDGRRVFALFATCDLVCLDLDGGVLWLRGLALDYPNATNSVGMASSLVTARAVVVVQAENDSLSFAAGLDAETGLNRWKLPRPPKPNWASPLVVSDGGRGGEGGASAVVLQSPDRLSVHDLATGSELWAHEEACDGIPSAVAAGGVLYVPGKGLTALGVDRGRGAPEVLWRSQRLRASTPSPLVHEGRVFALSGSILNCADASSGKELWQLRLEGPFSSSLVAAGGHLYVFNEAGKGQVVRVGASGGEVAGGGELGDTILCTPAMAPGALLVRSDGYLYKIAGS